MPILSIACLNSSRSSASAIAVGVAPMSCTLYFSSSPSSWSFMAKLRPVCPPTVGKMASGRSLMRICSTASGVNGSM